MSRNISWWTIDNKVTNLIIDGSLKHTLKQGKKINKRTRVLNVELKKFSGIKSYKKYVKIKTNVLRNISDTEETDDGLFSENDFDAPNDDGDDNEIDESFYDNTSANENKTIENEIEENEGNYEDFYENETIEGEEIEDEKYEEKYEEDEKYEENENNEEKYEENENNEEKYEENGISEEKYEDNENNNEKSEIIDETIDDIENNDKIPDSPKTIDETQKKPQPIIMCTEILKSKYTIIRSKDENDKSIIEHDETSNLEKSDDVEEVINVEKTSPETYRVSQLKRINLLYDSDDSDSSNDESNEILPEWKRRKRIEERIAASSQVISDPSDSDEWYTKNAPGKISSLNNEKIINHSSASSLYISDSDNDDIVNSTENKIVTPKSKKIIKKSLKSQINDQENNYLNNDSFVNKSHNNLINNTEPTEADSLQYILRNILSHNNTQDILDSELNTSTPIQEEIFPRPVELNEFIEREGFIHTRELSTIDIDEIRKSNDDDGDNDIWLMEIPKCIVKDRQLCGKKIILEKTRMKIDDTCYETISRKDKLVSCILSEGRDKSKYKAVNVSLVGSIVVRQGSSETSCTPLSQSSGLPKTKIVDLVPFPSHIKSRNPLMVLNDDDQRSELDSSRKNSSTESQEDEKAENISTNIFDNEIQERSEKMYSPSKISVTPKIPPQTIRRSTGTKKKKKKTPVWRRDNFLLSSKKNKNIRKKL